ncbi:hypothetical protein [Flavobacterium sp. ZE23DGlu08]|uniref:hypothetical protein n=1 Tax=Flavobacterium sp. ZE23DGlu08 TaxID=3059026 RepID=UPI0026604DC9|nr:hypothetical protein [Flavobacterium sp. ZE23DGlu08]WKL44119.1 hypothetical protein Q1W72_00495 [Flavobacterium sp. ZE23DGlu08]
MKDLIEIDAAFCNHYSSLLETQRAISEELEIYSFDLNKNDITQAIHNRMLSFWAFNANNCKDLGRTVNTVASDFFTETCLFFFKQVFKQRGMEVYSEKNILKELSRKSMRPDISIWKNHDLIAVIELKVSDGWKRAGMLNHLEERKKNIQKIYPEIFFGAIAYWDCFRNIDNDLYPNYLGLVIHDNKYNHPSTGRTIEEMIKRIIEN